MWRILNAEYRYQKLAYIIGIGLCLLPTLVIFFVKTNNGIDEYKNLALVSSSFIAAVWLVTLLRSQTERTTRRVHLYPISRRSLAIARVMRIPAFFMLIYALFLSIFLIRYPDLIEWRHIRFLLSAVGFMMSLNAFFLINNDLQATLASMRSKIIIIVVMACITIGAVLVLNSVAFSRYLPNVTLRPFVHTRQLLLDTAWTVPGATFWMTCGAIMTMTAIMTFSNRRSYFE